MDAPIKYQRQLLDQARQIYHQTPISDATVQAYLATPRHLFVRRYRERASHDWCEVNEENLHQHLAILYDDRSLTLFGDDDDNVPSTISQPSFVLRMLDLLQLISYGDAAATEHLLRNVHRWVDLGMPTAASFRLHVYQSDRHLVTRDDQWVVKRGESQFLWSLQS